MNNKQAMIESYLSKSVSGPGIVYAGWSHCHHLLGLWKGPVFHSTVLVWQPEEQRRTKFISAALSQLFHSNIKASEQKENY